MTRRKWGRSAHEDHRARRASWRRRRARCGGGRRGHLNAEQPRYRPGAMTEQSFELVLCRPVPERDLHNAWQTFCGWITRRTRAQYAMT